jgi:transcriptional regulator with XRE-family HTH domain
MAEQGPFKPKAAGSSPARRIILTRECRPFAREFLVIRSDRAAASISDLECGKAEVSAADLKLIADFLERPIEYFYGEDFGGKDNEDLIALLRILEPDTRKKVPAATRAMSNMQAIVNAIQSTSPDDEAALLEMAKDFYAELQPFIEDISTLYGPACDLSDKLATLFGGKS